MQKVCFVPKTEEIHYWMTGDTVKDKQEDNVTETGPES